MEFRYTEKIGYFLLALSFLTPFNAMIQVISSNDVTVMLLAPLWQYMWFSAAPIALVVAPFGLFYFFYYGFSVYIAKVAYDVARTQHLDRFHYAQRIVLIVILQLVVMIIIPASSGSPPPVNIPLPIVGVLALLLTRFVVKEVTEPWESQDAFPEKDQSE